MKKIFFIIFLTLLLTSQVSAAGLVPCGGNAEPPCKLCHILVMATRIIDTILLKIIPPLAILFIVIGGTYFVLGAGYDPNLINKAKALFSSVAIGLLIIYGAWLLVNLFFGVIGVATWTGLSSGWWQINCPI